MIKQFQTQPVYPTKSALKNYYLQSSLPQYVLNKQYNIKPLPKTHEFYKNDTFIWNNPYRSSKRIYKYFHQQQQEYKPIEENLKKQAIKAKEKKNFDRINLLKHLRQQDRNRLNSRKIERQQLQSQTYGQSRMNTLQTSASNAKSLKRKDLKSSTLQMRRNTTSTIDLAVQQMVQSTIMRQRQSRFQQLKDRKAQIQQLVRKSGQSLSMSRPMTSVKKSNPKFS